MDEEGKFKEILCMDTKGVLSLYEASYLSIEDESIMDMAQEFSTHHLKKYLKQKMDDHDHENNILVKQVSHALEMPLHWTMQKLEARWLINNVYEETEGFNPILPEFAKLDFNMLQALHLDELKQLSRWHKNINMVEMMGFIKDRLVEGFFWTVGFAFEPKFWYCREWITKLGDLIAIVDHIWDINAIEQLPSSMKICFLALFNSMNELADDILKQQDINILPFLRKSDEMERGEYAPKSGQRYMTETGNSEENAQNYMKDLIGQAWKKMNKEVLMDRTTSFSKNFVRIAVNFARGVQCMFQYGDGYGKPDEETKRRLLMNLNYEYHMYFKFSPHILSRI